MKQVGSTSMFHGLYTRRKAETLDLRTQEAGPFQSLSRSLPVLEFDTRGFCFPSLFSNDVITLISVKTVRKKFAYHLSCHFVKRVINVIRLLQICYPSRSWRKMCPGNQVGKYRTDK